MLAEGFLSLLGGAWLALLGCVAPQAAAALSCVQMTGRKGRVVRRPDGSVVFESRAEQGLSIDHVNLKEKERFMQGEKVSWALKTCTGLIGGGQGGCLCLPVPCQPQASSSLWVSQTLPGPFEGWGCCRTWSCFLKLFNVFSGA